MSAILVIAVPIASAETSVHKNSESGLLTYVSDTGDFSVELIQVLPDFIRAIYAKYDFPKEEIERIANFCVFGTIIKNQSQQTLDYDVSSWRYKNKGESFEVKTKSQWLDEWQKAGITFSWTLLPDKGRFHVGDWQQGFTTVLLPRESLFDLTYTWKIDEKTYSETMSNIQCPPENITNQLP